MLILLLCRTAVALWHMVPDPLPQVLSWPVSPVLLDCDGNIIHVRLSSEEEWCLPVTLPEMGSWLPQVLVAVEDKRFYAHPGVDPIALARALVQNLAAGRVLSGASTLTSQLVRLSSPRKRSYSTKLMEFLEALKLERSLSKEKILEYYLNRAPFGGPIRGVEAASRMYFGKRAKELSLGEASLLVGLLKGPTVYRPDRNPAAALQRRQRIIAKVAAQTALPNDLRLLALDEPLPAFVSAMPCRAWHFSDLSLKTLPRRGGVARSSLNTRVQNLLEHSLSERLRAVSGDITAAGIVVDNKTAAILAYVGNARFVPGVDAHWVDCAIAPRSPGSALKPFIYLAALEEGLIIPATLLADTPLQLGGEAPRNFDQRYRGPVSVRTALSASLNTPAVRVLRMTGVSKALRFLRGAGFSLLNREDAAYGDSLVLGGGEVTALELARAYTAMACLGLDRPLLLRAPPIGPYAGDEAGSAALTRNKRNLIPLENYEDTPGRQPSGNKNEMNLIPLPSGLADIPAQLKAGKGAVQSKSRRIASPAAAFLIADILKGTRRLPLLEQLNQAKRHGPIAFKTGTSFGLRDAWTAAYTPAHTVIIWFGREKGESEARLVGLTLAAPVAIDILRRLSDGQPERLWYEPPQGVEKVRVCALSGAPPSPFCPVFLTEWSIGDVWRTVPCGMHVLREGKSALIWPPELEDFQRRRFAAEDFSHFSLIVSPMPGARYLITPGAKHQAIALKAESVSYPVHWYANGEYLGAQEREDLPLYWTPSGGRHELSLLDSRERIASTSVQITDLSAVTETAAPLLGE